MPAALFGITNDALNLVVNLLILFLVVLWLSLAAWTYFDARRRLEDNFLVLCAAACSFLFPYVGTIVYSILRPPEFLADRRERELEIRASELRVRQLEESSCPNCEHPIERTFLRCPNCRARIKDPCESCGKPIDPRWSICPYCETPVRAAAPPERRVASRRRPKQTQRPPSSRGSQPPPQPAGSPPAAGDGEAPSRPPAPARQTRSSPTRSTTQRRTTPARRPKRAE